MGYDRIVGFGDMDWTGDVEVELTFIVYSWGYWSAVGAGFGWTGHEGETRPRWGWPLEGLAWLHVVNREADGTLLPPLFRVLREDIGERDAAPATLDFGVRYRYIARTENVGGGERRISAKYWVDGTQEPGNWQISANVPARDGSIILVAHQTDVAWGPVEIRPVP